MSKITPIKAERLNDRLAAAIEEQRFALFGAQAIVDIVMQNLEVIEEEGMANQLPHILVKLALALRSASQSIGEVTTALEGGSLDQRCREVRP